MSVCSHRRRSAAVSRWMVVIALLVLVSSCAQDESTAEPGSGEPTTTAAQPRVATTLPDAQTTATSSDPVDLGCGKTHESGEYEAPADGTRPSYWMVVPATYDASTPTPLYLNLSSGCGSHHTNLDAWRPYLEGLPGLMAIVNTQDPSLTTPGLLIALIDQVVAEYCVDRQRIHVMAMEWAGPIAERLACKASSPIASFASLPSTAMSDECAPGRPVALLALTTGTDREHTQAMVSRWIELNRCDAEPDIDDLGSGVLRKEYEGCAADILMFDIQRASHCFVFHEAKGPLQDWICEYDEVDYLEEAMQFFAEHPLS